MVLILSIVSATSGIANDVPEKIAGTYLVTESKGAKRLWTFTNDGNILSTSSAQEQFSFSDQKGTWHITDDGTISVLLMAFGFNEDKSVSYIARMAAELKFDQDCKTFDGQFVLRKYQLTEDPMKPDTDTGDPIEDTFHGVAVSEKSNVIPPKKTPQESKPEKKIPELNWISSGEPLGKWWLRRSRDYKAPNVILYHLDLKYSFNDETGNEEVTKHKLNASLILRKDTVTNYLLYSLKNKELDYRGSIIKTDKETFQNTVFIEALSFMDIMLDFQWEANDKKYYLNRYIYSGGLYFTLLNTKKMVFKIGGFYGHDKIEYMNELSELMGEKQEDFDADFFSIYQRSTFLVTDEITLSEKFRHRIYTGSSEYHSILNLNCNVKLTKHFSIDASYEIEREDTSENSNLEKEDRELSLGIKLSF
jgi:hypothetical protein